MNAIDNTLFLFPFTNISMTEKSPFTISLIGIVQGNKKCVQINNMNIYPIHYLSITDAEYTEGQCLTGSLKIMRNIKEGSLVSTFSKVQGIVQCIKKDKVLLENMDECHDISSLIPLNIETIVFVPGK